MKTTRGESQPSEINRLQQSANKFFVNVHGCSDSHISDYLLQWLYTELRLQVRTSTDPRQDLLKLLDTAERLMLTVSHNQRRLRV